jgi:hypothetical protein
VSIKRDDVDHRKVDFSDIASARRLPPVHPCEILRDPAAPSSNSPSRPTHKTCGGSPSWPHGRRRISWLRALCEGGV